ncbi:MAG: penicillin acylase family protein [Flavitalea sp.]
MRNAPFIVSLLVTVALVFALNKSWDKIPALGNFLSPQHGFWQNAVNDKNVEIESLSFKNLKGKTEVYFDERMVPHIFAENENDAFFVEGYLHARDRLWQMEMQTYAAAGRISEVAGPATLQFDRQQRRLGLGFAAQNLLKEIEKDPETKAIVDSYTAGVNAYIETLSARTLPLEYKLLGFKPEPWTNLKVALFVKQMAKTLASTEKDLGMTYAKNFFNQDQLRVLFPQIEDSLDPVIPKGTKFDPATMIPVKPTDADSAYINNYNIIPLAELNKPDKANGSNNWAVSGSLTKSGKPILANDPHLDLTLPSVWYEIQINTPTMNVYGVSFPGLPSVVIGSNDQIAWGVTNAGQDVRDYYEVKFKDASRSSYWFNGQWKNVDSLHIETLHVKGGKTVYDTVAYIDQGPVMFDRSFNTAVSPDKAYAVKWMVHQPGNELKTFNLLNHARNYREFTESLKYFVTPALNFAFASTDNDIALWQQGRFPARWNEQGAYIMPYVDNRYDWQGYIPQEQNPHSYNPARGFVSSANQRATDDTYPYPIPGEYHLYRGVRINHRLSHMKDVTPADMMELQKDNYNMLAATILPLMLKNLDQQGFTGAEKNLADTIGKWNYISDPQLTAPTIFKIWYDSLENFIWHDELQPLHKAGLFTEEATLAEALLRDAAFPYIDDINTNQKETLKEAVTVSFKKAMLSVEQLSKQNYQSWGAYKNTTIYHLLGKTLMPFARTGLNIGGGAHVINATQHNHGPSWKMVVEMTTPRTAWVIYPGGQSGNPGSKYYDNFVDDYADGKYYQAWIMKASEAGDKRITSHFTFKP